MRRDSTANSARRQSQCALGKKYMLKRKVKDPETGEEIWVEHKPDIAWFNMILERIEPVAKQTDLRSAGGLER